MKVAELPRQNVSLYMKDSAGQSSLHNTPFHDLPRTVLRKATSQHMNLLKGNDINSCCTGRHRKHSSAIGAWRQNLSRKPGSFGLPSVGLQQICQAAMSNLDLSQDIRC